MITSRGRELFNGSGHGQAPRCPWCRADIIRQAIEYHLNDIEDLRCGVAALKDLADPVLDWAEVRDALLAADAGRMRVVEAVTAWWANGSAATW